jgi:hypothetical protein
MMVLRGNFWVFWTDIHIDQHTFIWSYVKAGVGVRSHANGHQVIADGYKAITTQIFDSQSKYLDDDSVFAVKDSLVVEFLDRKKDPEAKYELRYDVSLAPLKEEGVLSTPVETQGRNINWELELRIKIAAQYIQCLRMNWSRCERIGPVSHFSFS